MAVAAPGGIALELSSLRLMHPAALNDQQVAWLCSVVAWVDLVDVQLPSNGASTLSRGIFAIPAAACRLCVPHHGGSGYLLEAARFAVEAARPGQQVCVWAQHGEVVGADAIVAEAEAIARGALDKDILVVQVGVQAML